MDILKLRSLTLMTLLSAANVSWAASCLEFPASFVIEDWSSLEPVNVEVFQYKKDSDFTHQEDFVSGWEVVRRRDEKTGSSHVLISPSGKKWPWLPVDADYRLVINGAVEYKITKIVSSNKPYVGCPLAFAVVNTCQARASIAIIFPQSCGRTIVVR